MAGIILLFSCHSNTNRFWTEEKAQAYLLNRQDSTKWDMEILERDLKDYTVSGSPFTLGVFPVPDYDLVGKGSFTGLGNLWCLGIDGSEKRIGNKTILYYGFFVKNSDVNKQYIGNRKDEVFFQIIVLTDFIDTVNYKHTSSLISSRNHPDYIGEGYFKTKENKIDFAAFITADRTTFAIVNMRLFNLKYGKTILIAPQKDNSLRSMQINSPELSSDDIDNYTDELLKQDEIIKFFTAEGNI
jgi:hypothetical protein